VDAHAIIRQAEKIKQISAFQKVDSSYSLGQEMSTDGGNRAKTGNNNVRSKTLKKLSRAIQDKRRGMLT
jgi:hypothetical protein